MRAWVRNPVVYEINTWVWLSELSRRSRGSIDLGLVPAAEWDRLAKLAVNAVWLMGVWERSPASAAIANQDANLSAEFRRALADFKPEDNVGSAYSIRRYEVDARLGGRAGLAAARDQLARRGMNLLLDFVPNHVATDHRWTSEHPEYFIRGNEGDAQREPPQFLQSGSAVLAYGRDPYFPPWLDVLQLNAFEPQLRAAAIETVSDIATQCDGVRCDMAMLVLNSIFANTWGARAGEMPPREYWAELIPAVRSRYPELLFIAEAYWDKEWDLQQLGFDYCYDKRLYDRLAHDSPASVRAHLEAGVSYQDRLLRFIENHDEQRAAAVFSPAKERAAAVTIATLPGATLFHDGQLEGRRVHVPVFLARRPEEPHDADLYSFYMKLLQTLSDSLFHDGNWTYCECTGLPDNTGYENLIAWSWRKEQKWCVVIINLSDNRSQARVRLPWDDLAGMRWDLRDEIDGSRHVLDGDEAARAGLYVDLDANAFQVLLNTGGT